MENCKGVEMNTMLLLLILPLYGGMYAGAHRYATKEDRNIIHGTCLENHSELPMIGQKYSC